jgi:hypothetical protein
MPGKAMNEDTEDSGLQQHAKVIIGGTDSILADRMNPLMLDESLINRMLSWA